jgi:ketosteroid isomerase-like protein
VQIMGWQWQVGLVAAACAGPGLAQAVAPADPALAARSAWHQAYATGDEAVLARLLRDDVAVVESSGLLFSKANLLSRAAGPAIPLTLTASDIAVRRYGGTAIVTSKVLERRGAAELEFRVTDTLVESAAGWQVAASHWTRTSGAVVEAKLPADQLERLTGRFRTPRGVSLTITRSGERLAITDPNGQSVEFRPVSPTQIAGPEGRIRWQFIEGPGGRLDQAVIVNQATLTVVQREPIAR